MSATAQPTKTNASIDKELLALEEQYWTALKNKDVDGMVALTYDPCIVTGAQGVGRLDHATFRAMMTQPKWEVVDFTLSDVTTLRLADDVAIVAYKISEKLNVDGKATTLDAADSSTWVRHNGKWVCAAHTESVTGDPYGRDRGSQA
jgi:hypothetical protein